MNKDKGKCDFLNCLKHDNYEYWYFITYKVRLTNQEGEKFIVKINREFDILQEEFSTSLMTEFFIATFPDYFLYCYEKLYYFNGIYWEEDNKVFAQMVKFIDQKFVPIMLKFIDNELRKHDDKNNRDSINKFYGNVQKLRNQEPRKKFIKDILAYISKDVEFNSKPNLFVFKNCVYDLNTQQVVKPVRDDYNTLTCGYNLQDRDEDKINDLNDLLSSIFPDVEVKNHYLEIMATGLCGLQIEKMFIGSGKGGNGKSLLSSLMMRTVGNYGYKLPSNVLTAPIKTGPNPEVANADNKCFLLAQEPEVKKNIVSSTLKELTGDKTLNVRGLYSSRCSINLRNTTFIESNDIPCIDEVGDAVYRRLDITTFVAKCVEQSIYNEYNEDERKNLIVQNPLYKTDEWQESNKMSFFYILVEYYAKFYANEYKLSSPPLCVKEASKKYLASCDNFQNWFDSKFIQDEKFILYVSDIQEEYEEDKGYTEVLTKRDKINIGKKGILDIIDKSFFLSRFLKQRDDIVKIKNVKSEISSLRLKKPALVGWRKRTKEDDDYEAEEEQ